VRKKETKRAKNKEKKVKIAVKKSKGED